MSIRLKVMTFNLRIRVEGDGINCFDFRRDRILEVISQEQPDLIGFQEATTEMLVWLKQSLSDYVVLGHGRGTDYHGEGIPIAYRRELFDLHRFEQIWLSDTPNVPASRFEELDQSPCARVLLSAELIHKDADKPISFFNIHTDHRGERARVAECTMLVQRLFESPFQFVLTGDFNDYPDSPSITTITSTERTLGTVDTTKGIGGTFHGFTGDVKNRKIDYIFTNLPTDPTASYAVADVARDGVYYSDHLALCAFVEI